MITQSKKSASIFQIDLFDLHQPCAIRILADYRDHLAKIQELACFLFFCAATSSASKSARPCLWLSASHSGCH